MFQLSLRTIDARLAALALLTLGVAFPASAQLATYTFEDTRAPTTTGANLSASAATYGPGLAMPGFGPGVGGTRATVAAGYNSGNSVNNAVLADYLQVTLTAAQGRVLAPTQLTFDVAAPSNGPSRLAVRSDADGFEANIGSPANPTTAFTSRAIDLSGPAFQNRTQITLRIYGFGPGTQSTGTLSLDNLVVGGTAVVPASEVASVAFSPISATATEGTQAGIRVVLGILGDSGPAGLNTAVGGTVFFDVDVSSAAATDLSFSGTFTFPVGSPAGSVVTIPVTLVNDGVFEGTETAVFVFRNVSGAAASGEFILTILDANPPPALFVNEINPTGGAVGEFVELSGPAGTSLTSLTLFTLVFFDAATNASYRTVSLANRTLDAGGRLVIGNASVPNVSTLTFADNGFVDAGGAVGLYQAALADFPNGTSATPTGLVSVILYGGAGVPTDGLRAALGNPVLFAEGYEGSASAASLGRLSGPSGPSGLVYAQPPSPGAANAATVAVDRTAHIGGGDGYRMLSAPVLKPGGAQAFNVHDLAAINLVQRVAAGSDAGGSYPAQYPLAPGPNLFLGFTGSAYAPAATTADDLTPGRGFFWRLYDLDIAPDANGVFGPGTSQSYALGNPLFRLRLAGTPADNGPMNAPYAVAQTQNPSGFYLVGNPFAYPLASTASRRRRAASRRRSRPSTASRTSRERSA